MTFDEAVTAVTQRTGCDRPRAESIVRANPHVVEVYQRHGLHVDERQHPPAERPVMNGLERRRAAELEALKRAGEIRSYQFEALKLILADRTTYLPDFLVEKEPGCLVIEEVKGHWRDDARVKIKVAARMFPMFTFRALVPRRQRDGGGWSIEEFRP